MDNEKLLSIIIPVYNVERYIGKCLSSILEQVQDSKSNDKVELIIINDGTHDDSMSIVGEFSRKFDIIRVINQENGGLSVARNEGLKVAIGKYVWFFDSDDYLKENALSRILEQLSGDFDLYVLGLEHVNEDGIILYDYLFPNVNSTLELLSENLFMVPLYIMRRDILVKNFLWFYVGIMHEDLEFTPRILSFVKNVKVLNFVAYCYLKRKDSITMGNGQYDLKRAYDTFKIVESLNSFRNNLCVTWRIKISYIISLAMNNVLQEEYRFDQTETKEVGELFFRNRKYFRHLILSLNTKYLIEGVLFMFMPKFVVPTFRFLKRRKMQSHE